MEQRGPDPRLAAAGGASLVSAGAIGIWLAGNWAPADPVRLLVIAAFGYMTIVGVWFPGGYRFTPPLAAGATLLLLAAMVLGPLVWDRYALIHPDALTTSPHLPWMGIVLAGPTLAVVMAWRYRNRFDRPTALHHWVALWIPLGLTVLAAGTVPVPRTPTHIGIIRSEEVVDGGIDYTLADRTRILIDHDESRSLTGRGGERELLLVGTHGGAPWHAILVDAGVGARRCFWLESHGVDQGSTILFDIGLVLPKDAEFQEETYPRNGRYEYVDIDSDPAPFCVDGRGRVTAYLGG